MKESMPSYLTQQINSKTDLTVRPAIHDLPAVLQSAERPSRTQNNLLVNWFEPRKPHYKSRALKARRLSCGVRTPLQGSLFHPRHFN